MYREAHALRALPRLKPGRIFQFGGIRRRYAKPHWFNIQPLVAFIAQGIEAEILLAKPKDWSG
jgi:hypothetical protein